MSISFKHVFYTCHQERASDDFIKCICNDAILVIYVTDEMNLSVLLLIIRVPVYHVCMASLSSVSRRRLSAKSAVDSGPGVGPGVGWSRSPQLI